MPLRSLRQGDPAKKEAEPSSSSSPSASVSSPKSPEGPNKNAEARWQPLRSARKAAAAVQQMRAERMQVTTDDQDASNTTDTSGTASNSNTVTAPQQSQMPSLQTEEIPNQEFPAYADNFTFAPMPNFVPISSCDVDPPDFDAPTDLKMSNNFTKLISNAKKVDTVRAKAKRVAAAKIDQNITAKDLMKKDEKLSVEDAQKRLIEQLKQGLKFLTEENKELIDRRNDLEANLVNEKENVRVANKKVEERNLKLAVLEHHFKILNGHEEDEDGDNANDDAGNAGGGEEGRTGGGTDNAGEDNKDSDEGASEKEGSSGNNATATTTSTPALPQASSTSIIQVDKGYFRELEANLAKEKKRRAKMEKVNEDLAMKYAVLERDSEKELADMTKLMQDKENEWNEKLTRQEGTIHSLEQSLNKSRGLLFKKGKKSHKRRATVSALPSPADMGPRPIVEEDDHSASQATMGSTPTDNEQEQDLLNNNSVKEAIASAVAEACDEQEKDHRSLMDVLSKQLELKDKHISSLETKMFSLLKTNKSEGGNHRNVSQDVMIRSMAVTNEVLDTSMRKLENMIAQVKRIEENENTDSGKNQIVAIRRVATRIALVHEEMKVSVKLIERKIANGAESIRQQDADKGSNSCNEQAGADESEQTSGEDGEGSSKQLTAEEFTEIVKKKLKEMESSIREEIGNLQDDLHTIEHELVANNDTIEGLEVACAEHLENYRALQKEIEDANLHTE